MIPRSTLMRLFPEDRNTDVRNLYRILAEYAVETYHVQLKELQQDCKSSGFPMEETKLAGLLAQLKGAGLIMCESAYEHLTQFNVNTERMEQMQRPVMLYSIRVVRFSSSSHEEKAS